MIRQPDIHTVAATLRVQFESEGIKLSHQKSLNMAAQLHGFQNWGHYVHHHEANEDSVAWVVDNLLSYATSGQRATDDFLEKAKAVVRGLKGPRPDYGALRELLKTMNLTEVYGELPSDTATLLARLDKLVSEDVLGMTLDGVLNSTSKKSFEQRESRVEALTTALNWVTVNYRTTLAGRPVRDADECLLHADILLGN